MTHNLDVTTANTIAPYDLSAHRDIGNSRFPESRLKPHNSVSPSPAVMEPSIVEAAGLGRFIYLVGKSRQRYVFSSIRKGQVSLYHEAIFAVVEGTDNASLWVGDYLELLQFFNNNSAKNNRRIFVHLLAESTRAKKHIVSDFAQTFGNDCLKIKNCHNSNH